MNCRIFPIDGQTWRIEEYDGENSVYMYLLAGRERAVLIDTGFGTVDLSGEVRKLTALPVEVILTHGHFDHIGGASLFEKVYMHGADRELYRLHSGEKHRAHFPQYSFPPPKDGILPIEDGTVFDLSGRTLRVIHTPGHSPGSVCVLDEERRWLFTGDTCCKADVLLNLEYGATVSEYAQSIERLQSLRHRFDTTWPAHHAVPVEPEILDRFAEAAALLCRGEAEGQRFDSPFGSALRFPYKDIAIDYLPGRV